MAQRDDSSALSGEETGTGAPGARGGQKGSRGAGYEERRTLRFLDGGRRPRARVEAHTQVSPTRCHVADVGTSCVRSRMQPQPHLWFWKLPLPFQANR